ncbi:MAG: hypothetical protein HYY92_03940 [Parcubacteria group bacterium]|nr:hypothetical protein [Parcubacteria group bacterium]
MKIPFILFLGALFGTVFSGFFVGEVLHSFNWGAATSAIFIVSIAVVLGVTHLINDNG